MSRTGAPAQDTPTPAGPTAADDPAPGAAPGAVPRGAATPLPGPAPRASRTRTRTARAGAWAELLRLPALFTVPGDALAGAAASDSRPGPRTLLAIGSSLCLYEAGMALNDWADRTEDAAERPHRPLPSGRIRPAAALTAAGALTGAGLALAAAAGRPALAVAAPLTATVWAYDLALKHTPAGPAAMAAARALDLLLGAATAGGGIRTALPSAALLGTHTLVVTAVSRRETTGGSVLTPLAALATTGALTRLVTHRRTRLPAGRRAAAAPDTPSGG
ncbi:SCO3242 family prenyltransferase, partial [Streptomyces sp. NPDC006999]|uniref:SCO3242 family prenyltransferase n=1 Tax=Streptomyces sp. NPDC006999 TaxID=3156909 RepID=UPI0033D7D801